MSSKSQKDAFSKFINEQKKASRKLTNAQKSKTCTPKEKTEKLINQMERYYKQKQPAYNAKNSTHRQALEETVKIAHRFIIARELHKHEILIMHKDIKDLFPNRWIGQGAQWKAQNEKTGGTMWTKEDLKAKIVENATKRHTENDGNEQNWATHYAHTFKETLKQMKKDGTIKEIHPIGKTDGALIMVAEKN